MYINYYRACVDDFLAAVRWFKNLISVYAIEACHCVRRAEQICVFDTKSKSYQLGIFESAKVPLPRKKNIQIQTPIFFLIIFEIRLPKGDKYFETAAKGSGPWKLDAT